MSVVAPLKGL